MAFSRELPHSLCKLPAHTPLQIQCLPLTHGFCAWSVQTLELFPLMNQGFKTGSSKWGASISMNPEVAQAPGDDCTQMPCAVSRAALQTGPDERLLATFLPLSLTAARGDFLQHVRQAPACLITRLPSGKDFLWPGCIPGPARVNHKAAQIRRT